MCRWAWLIAVGACGRGNFEIDSSVDTPPTATPMVQRIQVVAPGAGSSPVVAVPISQTAGHLLVAAAYSDSAFTSITDSFAEAFMPLPTEGGACGEPSFARLWYAQLTVTGNNVVTLEADTANNLGLILLEYAGLEQQGIVVDASSGQVPEATSNQMTAGTLDVTTADLALALFADPTESGTIDPGAGWDVVAHDDGFIASIEAQMVTSGPITPAATLPSGVMSSCWVAASVAFRAR